MNVAEQMQAQIALNKALPQIQMQLSNNNVAYIDYHPKDYKICLFKMGLM